MNIYQYGLSTATQRMIPVEIKRELIAAQSPEEIEQVIRDREFDLAQLFGEEFLVCDTAAELMAAVLQSKGIPYQIICGVNDAGDSHSYIKANNKLYDPTDQGFGLHFPSEMLGTEINLGS